MSKKILLSLLLILVCFGLFAVEKAVVRIPLPSAGLIQSYREQGYDIAAYSPGKWLDLVVPVTEIERLRGIHPDLQITQTEAQAKANLSSSDRTLPGYRSYADLMTELSNLADVYSNIMTMTTIGTGWGAQYNQLGLPNYADFNHNIVAIKLSNNPTVNEDEPAFFFVGAHHAREPLSVEATMAVLNDLASNYGADPWVTNLINTSAIWFVPMLNPDGHKIVFDQTDIWWRKNIRDNNANQQFETSDYYGYGEDGVDLNRNYGFSFDGHMSSVDDSSSVIYHGPNAFSEPETEAFRDLLLAQPFVAGISFHTYSELVLYPYGYIENAVAPDHAEIAELAVDMANLIPSQINGHYTPQPSWELYSTSGGLDDWAYDTKGIFSYTIEMGTTFIPDQSAVSLITQRVKPAARKLLDRTSKSMLTGHVTDSVNRQALEATIFVYGIDDSPIYRAPTKSCLPWGRFYRFLPDGIWNVRIDTPGYLPFETQVLFTDSNVTTLDVSLMQAGQGTLDIHINDTLGMPIEGAKLEFPGTVIEPMYSDATGEIIVIGFDYGYYNLRISKEGYELYQLNQLIHTPNFTFNLSNTPVISYNFDWNLQGWTSNGVWNVSTQQHHSGTQSLCNSPYGYYADDSESFIRLTAPVDLTNAGNASLSFYVFTDINPDGDFCTLEYSLDNQNWMALDFYNGFNYEWTYKSYSLNAFLGLQVYLRFHFKSTDYYNATGIYIDDFSIFANSSVANQDDNIEPQTANLSISPNPVKHNARISFNLKSDAQNQTKLLIYNLKGQRVATLLNKTLTKGNHETVWDGCDDNGNRAGSGVYFAVLSVNGKALLNKKMLLLK